jgi:hypothetical protein
MSWWWRLGRSSKEEDRVIVVRIGEICRYLSMYMGVFIAAEHPSSCKKQRMVRSGF